MAKIVRGLLAASQSPLEARRREKFKRYRNGAVDFATEVLLGKSECQATGCCIHLSGSALHADCLCLSNATCSRSIGHRTLY